MTSEHDKRKHWRNPRRVARIWWCGDDLCDCRQAVVEDIRPNLNAGYPWILRELVAEGTFFTDGEGGDVLAEERDRLAAEHGAEIE